LDQSRRIYNNWVTLTKNIAAPPPGEHPLASLFVDAEGKVDRNLTAARSWPHSMNNLQQCLEYLDKLKEKTEEDFNEYFPSEGPDKDKRVMFEQCLAQMDGSKTELENLHANQCKEGLRMLKIHLTPMLEPLKSLDYKIDEAQYGDFQVNDPFAKAFNAQAQVIHQHMKAVLNSVSCDEIMQLMAEQTCKRIENSAFDKKFSFFGALQFESDVRALSSFFTSVSEQALRHKFAKLREMSDLLNVESVKELQELYGEMRTWKLSSEEARKLLKARVDFHATDRDLDALFPA